MPEQSSLNNIDVKKFNKSRIFRAISESDKISQQEIANKLKISVPTVVQNVKELIDSGLVREAGAFESTGGRKAKALALAPDARLALGVDIAEDRVGIVAVDLSGQIIYKTGQKTPFACTDEYFAQIGESLDQFIEDEVLSRNKILGVGVSIPGIVNESQTQIDISHILGFSNQPTKDISRHIPFPTAFVNDANARGFAEFRRRRELSTAVYLSLSFAVGGSILFNDKLYYGNNQRAGELGHMAIVPGGKTCYCGKKGCLDAYCASKVLERHTDGDLDEFFRLLDAGDDRLAEVWKEYCYYLAAAINNLRMAFDCAVIVGGKVGGYLEGRSEQIKELLVDFNTFEPDSKYFKPCYYKNEAAAAGAALLHVAHFENNL